MRFKTSPPKGQRLPKPTSPGKSIPAKTGNFAAAITSLRNLLLSVNALRYDMEFLNISSGRLSQLITTLKNWRQEWFEKKIDDEALQEWIQEFYAELRAFLASILMRHKFYLPVRPQYQLARHIRLMPGKEFGVKHSGLNFPFAFYRLGKRGARFLHLINRFDFTVPIASCCEVEIFKHRFSF
jgi:hypothetical protein